MTHVLKVAGLQLLRGPAHHLPDGRRCKVAVRRTGARRALYAPTLPEAVAGLIGADGYAQASEPERLRARERFAREVVAGLAQDGLPVCVAREGSAVLVVEPSGEWDLLVSLAATGEWEFAASV